MWLNLLLIPSMSCVAAAWPTMVGLAAYAGTRPVFAQGGPRIVRPQQSSVVRGTVWRP
jgi:hypothetical protein